MSLSKLQEIVKDREGSYAEIHGVGHKLVRTATTQAQIKCCLSLAGGAHVALISSGVDYAPGI